MTETQSTHHTAPHALYRFWDANDRLLYVGITANPGSRWKQHSKDKPWWHDVTRVTIERYPDRLSVLNAERTAITLERPVHNVVHNGKRYVDPERPWDLAADILGTTIRRRYTVTLPLPQERLTRRLLHQIRDVLTAHPGQVPVSLSVTHDGFATHLDIDPDLSVRITDDFLREMRALLGPNGVVL